MITVLIPIGEIPYFVNANLSNIYSTAGVSENDIDFVFLTGKTIPANLQAAFDKAAITKPFRVISAPFEVTGADCHLNLLEWAFYHGDLKTDWIYTQHADVFWQPSSNWLAHTVEQTQKNPDAIALVTDSCGNRFAVDGKPILRSQGYTFCLHRQSIIDNAMTFQNGVLGTEVKLSPELEAAIDGGRVTWTKLHRSASVPQKLQVAKGVDKVDGADIIGMEIAVKFPNKIALLSYMGSVIHLWHFFDMYYDISRKDDTLVVNRTSKMAEVGAHYYSWVTSHVLDKDEFKDKILPWQAELKYNFCVRDDFSQDACNLLQSYADTTNIVGDDTNGLTTIQFTDRVMTF